MDMDMGGMGMGMMVMRPYLHFGNGDTLFFEAWTPSSRASIFGACFGVFMLALLERLLFAVKSVLEAQYARRALEALQNPGDESCHTEELPLSSKSGKPESLDSSSVERTLAPVIALQLPSLRPSIRLKTTSPMEDVVRGVLFAFQACISYALMLAIMTWNAGYIISIVLGEGIGEMLFGRFSAVATHFH